MEKSIEVHNLTVSYHSKPVLWDVDFELPKGKIIGVVGPNGSGKTTMLNVINGVYHPSEGKINYKGQARARMRPHQTAVTSSL